MELQRLDATSAPGPVMSRCVIHGDYVYIGGITATNLEGDIAAQTREVLATVDGYLERACSDRAHVLSVQVWLSDMRLFQQMNEVWNAWVVPGQLPARACVSGELFRPEALVEMTVTAVVRR